MDHGVGNLTSLTTGNPSLTFTANSDNNGGGTIKLSATNLKYHKNANSAGGYWIGPFIPNLANGDNSSNYTITYAFSNSEITDSEFTGTGIFNDDKTQEGFYANLSDSNTAKKYIAIKYTKTGENSTSTTVKYTLDFSEVTLDKPTVAVEGTDTTVDFSQETPTAPKLKATLTNTNPYLLTSYKCQWYLNKTNTTTGGTKVGSEGTFATAETTTETATATYDVPITDKTNRTEYYYCVVTADGVEVTSPSAVKIEFKGGTNPTTSAPEDSGGGSGGGTGTGNNETNTDTEPTTEEIKEANNEALESQGDGTPETTNAIEAAKEALENANITVPLTEEEVRALVQNQKEIAAEKTTEAEEGRVSNPEVPAASNLFEDNSSLSALDNLSAAPKATEPGRPNDTEQAAIVSSLSNLSNVDADAKADIPADFDPNEIQQATEENIEIASVPSLLEAQAEFIQDLFNAIKEYLTKVINTEARYGVTLATRMPALRPKTTGYFPMNINMRNLVPGQRLRYWSSTEAIEEAATAETASLAADDKEGTAFFLDKNGNPTTVVKGNASKMKVVPYLVAGKTYDSAFITVDATEEDQKTLTALAAQKTDDNSGSSSGGCELGLGLGALAAFMAFMKTSKKR